MFFCKWILFSYLPYLIFFRYGYGNDVCVVIAHRHFELYDTEVMYEVVDSDCRISQPRPLSEVHADKAQPNLLSCGLNGFWYPVGYGKRQKANVEGTFFFPK